MDSITAMLDDSGLRAALAALPAALQDAVNAVAEETANAIVQEARARLQRQLGPNATGATVAGITARRAFDGNGFVVVAEREPMPNLPLWIEKGTKRGGKGSHTEPARPFFYASVLIETGAHQRRVADAIQGAINASGL